MEGLIREGCFVNAICSGKGLCGKCRVRVLSGTAPISPEDRRFFSEEELADGMRLSCTLYSDEALTVCFDSDENTNFDVISDYTSVSRNTSDSDYNPDTLNGMQTKKYNIAIDIGTTTLAFQLLDKESGKICHTITKTNGQRQYGADVVSRIQASNNGKSTVLKESIRNDLESGILQLCKEAGIAAENIKKIAIACNTTMSHLLMGYDCSHLGRYPFTPVNIDFITGSINEIIGIDTASEVTILPGISAYVGGDIVSGLYACDFDKSDDICLFVDLGTNGEMALGNRKKILVASTAAGPAFEGGNISCGTGSIDGAVCAVNLDGSSLQIKTIREKPPVGICGTGAVELIAELLKEGLIDETGLLNEDYFDSGFPVAQTADGHEIIFTQKDIREMQLAKAAIKAGIETLIMRYGITKDRISRVYIAGGFGYRLNTEKAIAIGMIPVEFVRSVKTVGNTALSGAAKYLSDSRGTARLQTLINISEEIVLATDEAFSEAYMNSMMFPDK